LSAPLVRVSNLRKTFVVRGGSVLPERRQMVAVDDVSFDIAEGETVGLVGGSGSGKTTLARLILCLIGPDAGDVWFDGHCLSGLRHWEIRPYRRQMQAVFQDPIQSLNPRRTVAENISRPLLNFRWPRSAVKARVEELLQLIKLEPQDAGRYPHEISGGQCQRVAIARAIALHPRFIVLDEPVSSLDVSIQAQILNLLSDLQRALGLTYLFVSHDLKLVSHFCDRIIVMYRGRILEIGPSTEVYHSPKHPFTRAFLQMVLHTSAGNAWELAALRAEDLEESRSNDMPSRGAFWAGCVYAGACPDRFGPCSTRPPRLQQVGDCQVACHLYNPVSTTNQIGATG
jgi:peptide/nickel transport system ATP-binding protein/oligopeptide transport system ATP-binding protein